MRVFLAASVLAFLFFPFVVLLAHAGQWKFAFDSETIQVFIFTSWQASLSALFSMALGILGGMGLLSLQVRPALMRAVVLVCLVPNLVPTLLVILAALNIYPLTRGLAGIVWVHVLLNSGLVAVAFANLVTSRMGRMAELAWVEGCGRIRFLTRGVLPYLSADLSRVFLFVFTLAFSSFAVPLVIGGSRATTVEVLIYEKIRLAVDWSAALGLAFLQTLAIFALTWFLRGEQGGRAETHSSVPLVGWRPGLVITLIPSLVVMFGLVVSLADGIEPLINFVGPEIPDLAIGSLFVGFGTGILTSILLLALAFARPTGALRRVLLGYVAPSSVLTGFALLMLWRTLGWASYLKLIIGLALISTPALYRLQWDGLLASLREQIKMARIMGASDALIFRRVLLPQIWSPAMHLAGLASFWAWGDFTLSAVVGENSLTLAMVAHKLMGSYRLPAATALVWLVLAGGILTYLMFWGVGRVFGEKPAA